MTNDNAHAVIELTVPPVQPSWTKLEILIRNHTTAQARELLDELGFSMRVVKREGMPMCITREVRLMRVNVATVDDLVSEVVGMG